MLGEKGGCILASKWVLKEAIERLGGPDREKWEMHNLYLFKAQNVEGWRRSSS